VRHACTGFVVCRGGFRRISKADSSCPTENGGGESREQCDGIINWRVTAPDDSTHSEEIPVFLKPDVSLLIARSVWNQTDSKSA
jgi:hypothetical protein